MWKTESSRCHRILELLIGQVVMFFTKTGLCCESVGTIYLPKKYRGSLNSPRQPPFRSHLDVGNFLESRCSGETARIRLEDMVKPGFHDSIPSVGSMATFIALSFGASRVVPDGPEARKRQSQRQTPGIADTTKTANLMRKVPCAWSSLRNFLFHLFKCCRDPGSFLAHQVGGQVFLT